MAKHDQRILKFLNQNADRAPTITDMMTRLNISISDISASLSSLLAQGMISKKTNNQGIECWFPAGPAPIAAATQQLPQQQVPSPQASPWTGPEVTSGNDSRFITGKMEKIASPEPMTGKIPVQQVQSTPMAEISSYSTQSIPTQPAAAMLGLSPQPKGVGLLTFAVGLIAAVAVSSLVASRIATKAVEKASKSFVDQKAMTDITNTLTDFDNKTKSHVTALEEEVKKLSDQLAGKSADSLKVAGAKPAPAAPAAKAAPAPKPEVAAVKEKAGKGSKHASASKPARILPVVAKTSHAKKKKAFSHMAQKASYQDPAYMDPAPSSSASSSSSSDAGSSASASDAGSSAPAPSDMPPVDDPEKALPPPSE